MEARAINRFIGSSPRKMRLVVDLIRGESVDKALEILPFSPKHSSIDAEKTLRSAVSNLITNKEETVSVEPADLFVKKGYVNVAPTLKRISPAPQGREKGMLQVLTAHGISLEHVVRRMEMYNCCREEGAERGR